MIVPSVRPEADTPRQVERAFRRLLAGGGRLRPAGEARNDPECLLAGGYTPKHRIELPAFGPEGTTFFLTNVRQNPDIRYFVAYVHQGGRDVFPRIFYKDVSLVWRSASHCVWDDGQLWIGKGDVVNVIRDGYEHVESAEETTDLPLEVQTALEGLIRVVRRIPYDDEALDLVLRAGHRHRIEPYRDFTEPRRRAQADPRNLVNGGRPVARFTRQHDPGSLVFEPGYEPDFGKRGVVEVARSKSRLYGGVLRRYRIVSRNREIQYLFFAGPRHVWIVPPQATTTELSSFGVRTIDVVADELLSIPGYEYTFQIPPGFAGEPAPENTRADTSAWLDRMPVIQEFRRKIRA